MQISDDGLSLIKRFEGFSAVPYLCPARIPTIGYGHMIRPWEVEALQQVSEEEALDMLRVDATEAEQAVARFIDVDLTQHQFDALVSFTFNLGAAALQRSTLRRVVNRGEHAAVPRELMRWVWGGGRKLPGLVRRRAAEGAMYQS